MISKNITSAFLGITFLTLFLTACVPQTEEERIAAINKRIAPEGFITKTHLYINWPAYTVGDQVKDLEEVQGKERYKREPEYYQKVLLEPLKLKIPLEYLVPGLTLAAQTPTEYAEGSLSIHDHKITMVFLSLLSGAKVYKPLTPDKNLSVEEEKLRTKYFQSRFSVSIERNRRYVAPQTKPKFSSSAKYSIRNYFREADLAGLERYIETRCYDFSELKKRVSEGTHPNTLQRALDKVASKASDDHSLENCVEDRGSQYLILPLVSTPKDKSLIVNCSSTSCSADFAIMNRVVGVSLTNLGTDSAYNYEVNFGNSEAGKKLFAEAKATGKEIHALPQPRLDEVFTDLAKWQEKVEPTRELLNSFITNEIPPSLEINKSTKKDNKS